MNPLKPVLRLLHGPIYAHRLRVLVDELLPHIRAEDQVLDVGCGFGTLGRTILDDPRCPADVTIRGLEPAVREEQLIPVDAYAGDVMPYEDNAFDIVIAADVLHHEKDPKRLVDECKRVSRRLVIIKDHKVDGLLAQSRVSFIDWAANAGYGVPCLYRYHTLAGWREAHQQHDFEIVAERTSMNLYPPLVNLLFGRQLQYLAVLKA